MRDRIRLQLGLDEHLRRSPVQRLGRGRCGFFRSTFEIAHPSKTRTSGCARAPAMIQEPRTGRAVLEAHNKTGQTVRSRLKTPEGYSLTAVTAFDAARRVAAGEVKPDFQTQVSLLARITFATSTG